MGAVARKAVTRTADLLRAPAGLSASLREAVPEAELPQIVTQNVAADLAERALEWRYPLVLVYCERIRNELIEKFRSFSGPARMVVEVRLTHDRLDGLDEVTEAYIDAVTQVLDRSRGDWGGGMYYGGGYEADFGAVRRGGRGFLRAAAVKFEIHVSK